MTALRTPLKLTACLLFSLFYTTLTSAQQTDEQGASTQEAQSPQAQTGNKETLLDSKAPSHEKVWLNVAGDKKLAFYLNETSGKAHGGVLLIPDLHRHPTSTRGIIYSLRYSLADNHWHNLALNMADTDEETAQQLIAAGIKYLNGQGVFNIALLGEGAGAAQALQYVAALSSAEDQGQIQQIRALFMLNANNSLPNSSVNILQQLGQVKVPVLDAYIAGDYLQQQSATERKRAARRLMNKKYRQLRLPRTNNYLQADSNPVNKRIRGWLDKNVAGFMVDR